MFEAKHKEQKSYANVTNSRKYFILSAPTKFQLKFAHKLFFRKDMCNKVSYDENEKIITHFKELIFKNENINHFNFVSLKSITYNGTSYKSNFYVARYDSEQTLEALEIKEIIFEQLKHFNRYYLDKLFEIGSFNHIRELGREVQFVERFFTWKNSKTNQNNLYNIENLDCTQNEEHSLNYVSFTILFYSYIFYEFKQIHVRNKSLSEIIILYNLRT